MTIAKDLRNLNKDVKALGKKMEQLIKEFDRIEKANVKKKTSAKSVKPKTTRRLAAKKTTTKKPSEGPTATEQVLRIINRSQQGVDTSTLMKKTGFNQKKVWNILQRTYKQGKIKRAGKGIYVGA